MGRNITVAAAQMGPGSEEKKDNVQRMLKLLKEAARQDVNFIGFVELALTPFFAVTLFAEYDHFFEEEMPSPLTEPLFQAAKEANIGMVLPYAEKDPQRGCYYNSCIIIDCDGKILGRYRKTHIPGTMFSTDSKRPHGFEKKYFSAGDLGLPVFESKKEGAKIGVLICFDRRFPEAARSLALAGAEVVFVPYNTRGEPRISGTPPDLNEMILRTRAHENFFYVVGIGRAGVTYGYQYIGGSMIAEAGTGNVMAMATKDGDELITATIDLNKVKEDREAFHGFCERRPELYESLVAK